MIDKADKQKQIKIANCKKLLPTNLTAFAYAKF